MSKPLWMSPLARSCGHSNLLTFPSHITLQVRENNMRCCFETQRSVLNAHLSHSHFRLSFPVPLRRPEERLAPVPSLLHVTISLCHGTALCLGDPLQLCLQGKGAFGPVAQRQICRSQSSCTSNSSPQLVYCRTGFIIKKKKKIVSEVQGVIDASWFQLLAPHSSPSPHTTALFVDDFKMLQELHFPSTTYLRAF